MIGVAAFKLQRHMLDSKSDQRDAVSKYARTDSNSRLGYVPAEREVLQSSSRAKLLLSIIRRIHGLT